MVQTLYDFPLPNNGDRYDLSEVELDALLYKAYKQGYTHAKEEIGTTISASIEDKDDPTKWKEVWIK